MDKILRNAFFFFLFFCFVAVHYASVNQDETFDQLHHQDYFLRKKLFGSEDIKLLDRFEQTYEQYKHLIFFPPKEYKIPKIIHFIWLGPKSFPLESINNIRSWIMHHPEWTIYFWTDRFRLCPCPSMQLRRVQDFTFDKLGQLYREVKNWGEKSDILRYEIIRKEGGVYVDHDVMCFRSFDHLHRSYDFYAGACDDAKDSSLVVTVPNTIFGARAHHPILDEGIKFILNKKKQLDDLYPVEMEQQIRKKILSLTFPAIFEGIKIQFNQSDNIDIILPGSFFYNMDSSKPYHYSRHFFSGKWMKKEDLSYLEKTILRKLKKIKVWEYRVDYTYYGMLGSALLGLFFFIKKKRSIMLLLAFFITPLFGQNSSSQFIFTKEDFETMCYYQKVYKQCVSSLDQEESIPKIIHFIYLDPRKMPKKIVRNMIGWTKKNPDWIIRVWTNKRQKILPSSIETCLVKKYPFFKLRRYMRQTNNYAEQEDLLKYDILYHEGGVVIDKNESHPFSLSLLDRCRHFYAFLSLSQKPVFGSAVQLSHQIIASKPKHKILKRCFYLIEKKWLERSRAFPNDDETSSIYRAAYRSFLPFQEAAMQCLDKYDKVFPMEYKIDDQQRTFSNDNKKWTVFDKTFTEKIQKKMEKIIRRLKQIVFINTGIILIGWGFFIKRQKKKK